MNMSQKRIHDYSGAVVQGHVLVWQHQILTQTGYICASLGSPAQGVGGERMDWEVDQAWEGSGTGRGSAEWILISGPSLTSRGYLDLCLQNRGHRSW